MGRLSSTYCELPPPPRLAASVACVWMRHTTAPGTHLVVPDGCIDLVATPRGLLVAGPDTGPMPTAAHAGTTIFGLRFRPGAAAPVLGWPAHELRDRRTPLEELWGQAMRPVRSLADLIAIVDGREAPPPDPIVRAAVHALARGRRVSDLPAELHLSERQLRRRFHAAVGYGPKVLARVLRLQRMFALAPWAGDNLARLAAEAGYADHAHLASETVALTGLTPRALLDDRFAQAAEAPAA
jgi:AraC-like DNA-binding protein